LSDCPHLQLEMSRRRGRAPRYFCTAILPKRSLTEKKIRSTCSEEAEWRKCPFLKKEPSEEAQRK